MSLTTINNVKSTNNWEHDDIAARFDTHRTTIEIHPDAAVNIDVGWPVFFEQIKYQADFLGKQKLNILDFGCGAGGFCTKLHEEGHTVVGLDKSEPLIHIARSHSPKEITYCLTKFVESGEECSLYKGQMDMITAMHSFEWNENIEDIIKGLSDFLLPNGIMLFAVFPKGHVVESLEIKDLFEDFDSKSDPTKGFCNFDGIRIPVFIRDASYFDMIYKKINYEKVLEFYPQFPKAFLTKYNWTGAKYPEMLVLAYRKLAK